MLGDPVSIFFQTELQFLPMDDLRFGKTFVRSLYAQLANPGGYAYEDLSLQTEPAILSSKRVAQNGTGSSVCRIWGDRIVIEETEPFDIQVDGFIEIAETVLKAVKVVKKDTAPIFAQKCVIHCIAKPKNSTNSIVLLAGKVTNVLNRIDPFRRPPQFFGIRFRFPPCHLVHDETAEKNGESPEVEEKNDFTAVRFETWGKNVEEVWIEVSAMNFFPEPIDVSDATRISKSIRNSYQFVTNECIDFLNQFDDLPNTLES